MSNKLPKYTLSYDKQKDNWKLENDTTDRVIRRFETKEEATAGGVLRQVVGSGGGSVKIKKMDNDYQEERTYPKSADPKKSKG